MRARLRVTTSRERNGECGASIIEFILVGIPLILLLTVVFEICLAMWSYHTLASAVEMGAKYAATKGQDCTYAGNNCTVEIYQIVQSILASGIGIDSNRLDLTFYSFASPSDTSPTVVTCNPASSCLSNSTQWPPEAPTYKGVPDLSYIDISAHYPAPIFIPALLWPGQSFSSIGTVQFSASSRQIIQF